MRFQSGKPLEGLPDFFYRKNQGIYPRKQLFYSGSRVEAIERVKSEPITSIFRQEGEIK